MNRELLKIIKEAENIANKQNKQLFDFHKKLDRVYHDLQDVNIKLKQVNNKIYSANKD